MAKMSEKEDTADVKVEAKDELKSDKSTPKVTIAEPAKPEEPQVSEQTKAEMEAGKKAVEESTKAAKDQAKKPE